MEEVDAKSEFYDVVDEFINLANKLRQKHSSARISAVIAYAASRYNAFNFFVTDGDEENEEKAIDYCCEQYKLMLLDNFDETRANFTKNNEKN